MLHTADGAKMVAGLAEEWEKAPSSWTIATKSSNFEDEAMEKKKKKSIEHLFYFSSLPFYNLSYFIKCFIFNVCACVGLL